jgi:hypothetical protein
MSLLISNIAKQFSLRTGGKSPPVNEITFFGILFDFRKG